MYNTQVSITKLINKKLAFKNFKRMHNIKYNSYDTKNSESIIFQGYYDAYR